MVLDRSAGAPARAHTGNHPTGERRRLLGRLRGLVALALSCALASLIPIAHADPPDPTWMSGIYDGGDHDDVILLVSFLESMPDEGRLSADRPVSIVASLPAACAQGDAVKSPRSGQPRAPPAP